MFIHHIFIIDVLSGEDSNEKKTKQNIHRYKKETT